MSIGGLEDGIQTRRLIDRQPKMVKLKWRIKLKIHNRIRSSINHNL